MKKILWLSQSEYIVKVLKHFNMDNAKLAATSFLTSGRLSDRDSPSINRERERERERERDEYPTHCP